MALYFITGVQGSGKSTVLAALKRRGYEAYDVDEAGPATAKWHHNTSSFVHPKSSVKKEARTSDFLANHSWKVPRQEVADLSQQASEKPIFLGGNIANEPELQDLFSEIFALTIDDETLRHRLANRTDNDWGQNLHELELSLTANHKLSERYAESGYVIINASQTTDAVIAEILTHIHDH